MGPAKKSKSVNKRFSYSNEIAPTKDGDNTIKKNQRKKKLSDMLGPQWSKEELEHFYEAYRKHGKDWRKVASVLKNRSMEMVESVYSLNKAYLSLPEGTASVAGFLAMMTDYYSNMEDRDSDHEKGNGVGTSKKPQKRLQRKVHEITPKVSVDNSHLHPGGVSSDYGFMSLLKKKRSGGSRPRVVGKRTPRFPVSHSYENVKGEKSILPSRKVVKSRADNDEDVAHSIAIALAEASKRGSSPNRKSSSLRSSPSQSAERMYDDSDVGSGYGEDIEGSMEADNTDFHKNKTKEKINSIYALHDRKGSQGKKIKVDKKENKHLDYIREACSGTEGHNLGTIRRDFKVSDEKPLKPSQGSKKRSKGAHTDRDENSAFDALETLANLSLMILPEANRNGKDELIDDSHLLLSMPTTTSCQGQKRKSSVPKANRSLSKLEAPDNKAQTSNNDTNIASEPKDSHHLIAKMSRKRQKIVAPKISKAEAASVKESLRDEATYATQSKGIAKNDKNAPSSSIHSIKDIDMHATKLRSKHKLFKTDTAGKDKSILGQSQTPVKLCNCLSNKLMRRWCACEFFYSAMDQPWFAKQEFVEYLYHVGLGHVPRLTRVEWGVIRSSLGKPRRFSTNFLKEEKEKLNQYQDSVRTHYTELLSGSRDGLPTDLARPLSVGQRVIAIYPKTREIHDGTVLTVDHDRCRVQFDRPELGVEKIMDTDCMPLNPYENMPASLMHQTPFGKYYESLNEGKMGKDQRLEGGSTFREQLENTNDVNGASNSNHHGIGIGPHSTLAQFQAKEADVEAIAELTRALDKKEAVVLELRRMNDDVLENQTDGDFSLQDSDAFKKQYAAVLVQLNEANSQVSSALFRLRQRNTYQSNFQHTLSDYSNSSVVSNHTEKSKSQVNEIAEISRTKARTMVDIAIQAMSSLKLDRTVEIDKAVDYVNDRLPLDDSFVTVKAPDSTQLNSNPSGLNKASVPSELITQCVATLFIIQKCTERQFPPAEVASILDSAVSSLQPWSPQNVQVYAEIQKCMGIIKNQILALVPT